MTMNKVKTLDDLKKMRESLRASLDLREKSNTPYRWKDDMILSPMDSPSFVKSM